MRFIPLIDGVPDDVDVVRTDDDYAVLTPLAMSEDGYQMVAVESRLLFDRDGEYEFKFAIAVFDEGTGEPFRIFDPNMARGYLPNEVRRFVMPSVCRAAEELIRQVQPNVIHRVTFLPRPDDKALEKHHMITDTIVAQGLTSVTSTVDRWERKCWRMSRNGEKHGQD